MYLNRDTAPTVVYADFTLFTIHRDFDGIHVLVTLLVVGGVDQNFVKNLIQPRNKANFSHFHGVQLSIINPHLLFTSLNRSDVGVRPFKDVLELGELHTPSVMPNKMA